jgi:plastocyanin
MKTLYIIAFILLNLTANATTWQILVGGNQSNPNDLPNYSPNQLNIYEGDVVEWVWMTSNHSVTSTGGVTSFDSGVLNAGQTFSVTFTTSGFIVYESTVAGDAETMFGSIFVNPGVSVSENEMDAPMVSIYPNPATDFFYIDNKEKENVDFVIYDACGRAVQSGVVSRMTSMMVDTASLTSGVYFIRIRTSRILNSLHFLKQ